VGYAGKYISFRIQSGISPNIFEVIQSGQKGNDVIGLNHLYSTIELTTNESISLIISTYEFIDKLLPRKRFKTGSEQFDDRFLIRTTEPDLAMQIFGNLRIKDFFLRNHCLAFNINSGKQKTTISLKDMRQIIFSEEYLQTFITTFEAIIAIVTDFTNSNIKAISDQ